MRRPNLKRARLAVGVSLFALAALIGCGSSAPTVPSDPGGDPVAPAEVAPTQPVAPAEEPSTLVQVKNGKQWIGDVPLDVWFDDPYAVASDTQSVAVNTPAGGAATPTTDTPKPETPAAEPPKTGNGPDWKSIITAKALDDEVTQIRNRFNKDLQTLGTYNNSYLALPPHTATLAVLAGIAKEHPEDIRWKDKAGYIMSLSAKMNAEKLRQGATSYRPLKEQFDSIVELLAGSVPPGLEEPPADQSIPESTDIGYLMQRLKVAENFLQVNGGSAELVKSKADELKHEAMVLGAVSAILNRDGFGYEGDPGFDAYVDEMVQASQDIRNAVEQDQFEAYGLAVSKITQTCTACHGDYRG